MPIPEHQLDTWTHQGRTQQFTDTYASIKGVLEHPNSPYANRRFDVYLQGSYCNDTNVHGDSDVDIVICCSDSYHYDLDHLADQEKAAFNATLAPAAGLSCDVFRGEVLGWLARNYPRQVTDGRKAISIAESGVRRSADVIPCLVHKQYTRFQSHQNEHHHAGIQFKASGGQAIVNFPKIHSVNCTAKHQATNSRFKYTARMFKNMRNRLLNHDRLADGVAPSYYIEGMLWNCPNDCFDTTWASTFVKCHNWLENANKQQLVCANQRRWLLRDGKPDSWSPANFNTYMAGLKRLWNDWPNY